MPLGVLKHSRDSIVVVVIIIIIIIITIKMSHTALSVILLNTELQDTITIRSLLHLCTACNVRKPPAYILALAVQNSIPCLVGLPMDNPDPEFYINIARNYFRPLDLTIKLRSDAHRAVTVMQDFMKTDLSKLWCFPWSHYVMRTLGAITPVLETQTGRKYVKELLLEWMVFYQQTRPRDPRYSMHIDNVIRRLDYAFILCDDGSMLAHGYAAAALTVSCKKCKKNKA